MSIEVKISLENEQKFIDAIKRAKAVTEDLRIPLTLIAKQWFKGNKAIFTLSSKGQYEDLSETYKKQKQKAVGFIYPILKRKGALMNSITNPSDPFAVNQIANKDTLYLGTKIDYGRYNQPRRPFVFIGPEQPYFSNQEIKDRPQIWLNILNDFVLQKLKQEMGKE